MENHGKEVNQENWFLLDNAIIIIIWHSSIVASRSVGESSEKHKTLCILLQTDLRIAGSVMILPTTKGTVYSRISSHVDPSMLGVSFLA